MKIAGILFFVIACGAGLYASGSAAEKTAEETIQGAFGISHSGIIDLYRVKYKGVDILDVYTDIARELSSRGL